MSAAQYARLVPKKHRSKTLPKMNRPIRPRVIAWAGPAAFYPNRFYEINKWYKARIDKPEKIPELYIIDPSEYTKSLEERLQKAQPEKVNIGFKKAEVSNKIERSTEEKSELERKARHMELIVEVENIEMPNLAICHHYQIFEHLFGEGVYFDNVQGLSVSYDDHHVFTGNVIDADVTKSAPKVVLESVGEGYNTILMVNLDGNPFDKNGELVQWLVANIPDGKSTESGDEIVSYLQPTPFYGTGYHRVAVVSFRHSAPISIDSKSNSLVDRVKSVAEFYKSKESEITPSAIKFFQTTYDDSVKEALHSLGEKSPIYEYTYTPALKPEQKEFPERSQPFDLYLDMFRDPQEVEAEMLEKRLARVQLDNVKEPKFIDENYQENKKLLPEWLHRQKITRGGRNEAIYKNPIQ